MAGTAMKKPDGIKYHWRDGFMFGRDDKGNVMVWQTGGFTEIPDLVMLIPPAEWASIVRALDSRLVTDLLSLALDESVKLQSHYARLLNLYDGGQRLQFVDSTEWLARLETIAITTPTATCISKAMGGEWCIGKCCDPRDCSAQPKNTMPIPTPEKSV